MPQWFPITCGVAINALMAPMRCPKWFVHLVEQPGCGATRLWNFRDERSDTGQEKVPLLCSAVRDFNEDYSGFSPIEVDTVVARRFRSMTCVLTVSPPKV